MIIPLCKTMKTRHKYITHLTFGALIGYSSGRNNSNLNTPPSNGDPSGPGTDEEFYKRKTINEKY